MSWQVVCLKRLAAVCVTVVQGVFDDRGEADSVKVAVVSREYEALVARQLQEQQR